MSVIGNILWVVLGGLLISIYYFIGGVVLCLTIIGIPFGLQLFKIASFALMPFGSSLYNKPMSDNKGCLMTIMNIFWIILFGLEIAIIHFILGCIFYITIIGIPFGNQHFKLMRLAIMPFGTGLN